MNGTKGQTAHLRKASITDLPPELLSIIFGFVYYSTSPIQLEKDIIPTWMRMEGPEGFKQAVTALVHPTIPEEPNLKSPTLFPYSLAAVCSFWRDVLCSHPEFWTLVVLFVDSKPTSLVEASLFLKWSGKQHIDVVITRRDGHRPAFYPDRHEKYQIDAFLPILRPHLRRCRSLHIDAQLNSTFPIIRKTFGAIQAPHLKYMELVCNAHAYEKDYEYSDGDLEGEFEPQLTRLVIDGKNFCQPSEESTHWMDNAGLKQLTIAKYEPGNDEYSLDDLLESLQTMTFLEQLKLEGLIFTSDCDGIREIDLKSSYVHLEDVSGRLITNISKSVYLPDHSVLRITRCHLVNLYSFGGLGAVETLVLEDISSYVDLLGAITAWEGRNLWLDHCYSFSNMFLKALGRRRSHSYPCDSMRRLLLYRLPKFSISSLKKMIEKRNSLDVDYDDPDWKTASDFGPAISHLAVVQCGLGRLSAQDEEWFRAHLVEFYWSSWFFFTYFFG